MDKLFKSLNESLTVLGELGAATDAISKAYHAHKATPTAESLAALSELMVIPEEGIEAGFKSAIASFTQMVGETLNSFNTALSFLASHNKQVLVKTNGLQVDSDSAEFFPQAVISDIIVSLSECDISKVIVEALNGMLFGKPASESFTSFNELFATTGANVQDDFTCSAFAEHSRVKFEGDELNTLVAQMGIDVPTLNEQLVSYSNFNEMRDIIGMCNIVGTVYTENIVEAPSKYLVALFSVLNTLATTPSTILATCESGFEWPA